SQVEATGSNIRLNLSQVLRGKPLQLMERFPVDCALVLSPDDLRASLRSPIFAQGLTEVLLSLFQVLREEQDTTHWSGRQPFEKFELQGTQVELGNSQLILKTQILSPSGKLMPLSLEAHLEAASPCELLLTALKVQAPPLISEATVKHLRIDLGPDVDIQQLCISPEGLLLQGQIWVNP
ncbi:MAG: LmeA family phospholipid-binding protein, partial [Microcoleaceae cyanobacterium]